MVLCDSQITIPDFFHDLLLHESKGSADVDEIGFFPSPVGVEILDPLLGATYPKGQKSQLILQKKAVLIRFAQQSTLIRARGASRSVGGGRAELTVVVGLDLAGSERRNTGFCTMDPKMYCRTEVLHTDAEILSRTIEARPTVISIDAPLFLPLGRKSIEDRGPPHFRECDKELLRMHIRFFPISLGPMRMLLTRGMKLRTTLEGEGFEVIESFPGAIQDLLHMPRKQRGLPLLAKALRRYGVSLGKSTAELSGDELDAVTSALVGLLYMKGEYRAIGDPVEGLMILPRF
jgi:predicted nuclease with RNAse H fold